MSKTTHGLSGPETPDPLYRAWGGMKARCLNPNHHNFHNYGGRGIRVCDEWKNDAAAFARHMGPRPTKRHTVERIDNNGNYEPGNVRWATSAEQVRNQRRTKLRQSDVPFIRHWMDIGHSIASIARAFGVSRSLVSDIKSGKAWRDA